MSKVVIHGHIKLNEGSGSWREEYEHGEGRFTEKQTT